MTYPKYQLTRGSDIVRDGMYLELSEANTSPIRQLAEVFYSDVTHDFVLTYCEDNIPLEVIEWLIAESKRLLPQAIKEKT